MSGKIYIVGGQEKSKGHKKREWHKHAAGRIVCLDIDQQTVDDCVTYVSPDAVCPDDDPTVLFKAGTMVGDRLYVCTQTEVLIYQLPSFERVGYVSIACFNDVHHVRVRENGNLLVVVTGLDMVVEVSDTGDLIREWGVLGESPWIRFSRDVDYRKVVTTKPHQAHPNYVFEYDGDIWATRFEQRDAIALTNSQRRLAVDVQNPHDGIVVGDLVYFTTVNGCIVRVSADNESQRKVFDLNEVEGRHRPLGWLRGILFVDAEHVIVGFSRIRPSRIKKNLQWIGAQFGDAFAGALPTRVAQYDLSRMKVDWVYDLEPHGINTVFSVHSA